MSQSTHKRAYVLHCQLGAAAALAGGYLEGPPEAGGPGPLRLLTPEGQTLELARERVLAVFQVARFVEGGRADVQEWMARRAGTRQPGLWVRVRLREHRGLEGIVASDLLDLASGLTLTPLVLEAPWQRVWVPRAAIAGLTAVEVVRPPRRRRTGPRGAAQPDLFGNGADEPQTTEAS